MVKGQKYHILYKTTCTVTGNFYIGVHSTTNLEDGYLGSGKRLRYSIEKHGKENHLREILEFFSSREELMTKEREIVNEDLRKEDKCMNLKNGGEGGFCNEEHKRDWVNAGSKAGVSSIKKLLANDSYYKEFCEKRKADWIRATEEERKHRLRGLEKCRGKKHTAESKLKIGKGNSVSQKGEKNSQYGKIWIYSDTEKRSIKIDKDLLESYISKKWKIGRRMKF